jgi:RNA polymerase sigma factor (sigma-70 family)
MSSKEETLRFEQVEDSFHKWAGRLSGRKFEHWELINSAWLYGKVRFLRQSQIKFASMRIKYDMIDYMRRETFDNARKAKRAEVRESRIKQCAEIDGKEDEIGVEQEPGSGGKGGRCFYVKTFSDIVFRQNRQNGDSKEVPFDIEIFDDCLTGRKDFINTIIKKLIMSRTEKLFLKLYYVENFTLKEIGKVCGLHESRISQIKSSIIKKLKTINYLELLGCK